MTNGDPPDLTAPAELPNFSSAPGTSAGDEDRPVLLGGMSRDVILGDVSATTAGTASRVEATAKDGRLEPAIDKPDYVPIMAVLRDE
jgi:hypothetical protein